MDKNTTYQTGNTAATKFESLVNRLYVSLCFAANRFLCDKTAAQDIVQEAFARLWELQGKNKNIENIDNLKEKIKKKRNDPYIAKDIKTKVQINGAREKQVIKLITELREKIFDNHPFK